MPFKKEDRARGKMTYKRHQNLIFFIMIFGTSSANNFSLDTITIKKESDQQNNTEDEKISHDEQLLKDLSLIATDFYKKVIETTVLYFTGMLQNSDQFHKQLALEVSKHALYASQIFTEYFSKLLKDPKVSWKLKVKRCAYISSFLIIMIIWMKEFHKPTNNSDSLKPLSNFTSTMQQFPDHASNFSDLQPRQKQKYF